MFQCTKEKHTVTRGQCVNSKNIIQKSLLQLLQCHCLATFPREKTPKNATLPALERAEIFFVFLE